MQGKRFDIESLWWNYLSDKRYEKLSSGKGYDREWTYRGIVERYNKKYEKDKISVDVLKFYFNGYRDPSALRFLRICDVMEINPIDIFFNESVMQAVSDNDYIETRFSKVKEECSHLKLNKNYNNSDLKHDLLKIFKSKNISYYAIWEKWLTVKDNFNFKKERSLEPCTLFKYEKGMIDEISTFTMFILILMNYIVTEQ